MHCTSLAVSFSIRHRPPFRHGLYVVHVCGDDDVVETSPVTTEDDVVMSRPSGEAGDEGDAVTVMSCSVPVAAVLVPSSTLTVEDSTANSHRTPV
jgi:hypothetical protein